MDSEQNTFGILSCEASSAALLRLNPRADAILSGQRDFEGPSTWATKLPEAQLLARKTRTDASFENENLTSKQFILFSNLDDDICKER